MRATLLNTTGELLKSACEGAVSLLFPYRCSGCDLLDVKGFCSGCFDELEWIDPESYCCVKCCEPVVPGMLSGPGLCPRCRKSHPTFEKAVSALRYTGPMARAIVLWKYEGNRYLSGYFAQLLCDWVSGRAGKWFESIDIVVPAPLHPKTLSRRGFSPPEELGSVVASKFNKNYIPRVLFKVKFTQPQARLNMDERVRNVRNTMMVFDRSLVEGKSVLVVDDVMTTGATMSECARSLKAAGVEKVYGLTLARQAGLSPKC